MFEDEVILHLRAIEDLIGDDQELNAAFIQILECRGFVPSGNRHYNQGIDDLLKRIVENIGDLKLKRCLNGD